jgi:hypothetical protein
MAPRNPVMIPPPSGEGDEGKHHKILTTGFADQKPSRVRVQVQLMI